jgi:hypothetical protein
VAVRIAALAAVAALVAVSPAAARSPAWPAAKCRAEAATIAEYAQNMLRHYDGMVYPADVEYLRLRNGYALFLRHRCAPSFLGVALRRELTPRRRARLLELLPAKLSKAFRHALAVTKAKGV